MLILYIGYVVGAATWKWNGHSNPDKDTLWVPYADEDIQKIEAAWRQWRTSEGPQRIVLPWGDYHIDFGYMYQSNHDGSKVRSVSRVPDIAVKNGFTGNTLTTVPWIVTNEPLAPEHLPYLQEKAMRDFITSVQQELGQKGDILLDTEKLNPDSYMQLPQEVEPVLTFVAKHGEEEIERRSSAFSMTRTGEWKEIGFVSPPSAHEEGVLTMVKRTNQFLIEQLNALSYSDSPLQNQQVNIPNTDIRVHILGVMRWRRATAILVKQESERGTRYLAVLDDTVKHFGQSFGTSKENISRANIFKDLKYYEPAFEGETDDIYAQRINFGI